MESRNGNLNAHIQGSVWMWTQRTTQQQEPKKGVQSSGRPILIVSNNTFNTWSPSVNCLTITSQLRESPVHVPVNLDVSSHIQCEQIHTIPKIELSEYKGVISPVTLANVKAKLNIQFDMGTDRSLEILSKIKNSMDALTESASTGFGLPAFEKEVANTMVNIHNCFTSIKTEIQKLRTGSVENVPENVEPAETVPETDASQAKAIVKGKRSRGGFSDDEIAFIIDEANSISDVVELFEFKDRATAYRARSYYKRKQKGGHGRGETDKHDTLAQKKNGKHRVYSEEDKRFIIDKSHSVDEIMERFDYKDKATASKMRSYFRKNYKAAI